MMSEKQDLHLVEWLRRIQLSWELDLEKLSKLCHVDQSVLKHFLDMSSAEVSELPSIPTGLESAVALVGIYRRVSTVYKTPEEQNQWLTRANSVFEGNRPIDVMSMSPDHLAYVSYTVESGLRLGGQE